VWNLEISRFGRVWQSIVVSSFNLLSYSEPRLYSQGVKAGMKNPVDGFDGVFQFVNGRGRFQWELLLIVSLQV